MESVNQQPRVFKIGLTVMVAVTLLYLALAWINRVHFFAPEAYPYTLHFEAVNGLLVGDPVKVRGVQVGRVKAITPQRDLVAVDITIDQQVQLFEDAQGIIELKELMGGKQLTIYSGQSSKQLPPGSTLPGNASMDFSNAFNTVDQLMDRVNAQRAQQLVLQGDTMVKWLSAMMHEIPVEAPGQIMQNLHLASNEMARISRISQQSDWPEDLALQTDSLIQVLRATQVLLAETQHLMDQLDSQLIAPASKLMIDVQELTPVAERVLMRTDTLTQLLLTPDGLASQLMTDPAFAHEVDSTLVYLIKVLKQISEEKIIVGLKRKKP